MTTRRPHRTPTSAAVRHATPAQEAAQRRVRRNFWTLVAATTVAVGVLSVAVRQPPGAATATITLVSSFAALAGLALAGRILVVTSRRRPRRRQAETRAKR